MSKVTNRITIKRPIRDVFAVLTDVENAGTWFPGNVEEHWTSPPPHGIGSTRHAVVVLWGRRTENDAVTTEYRPPYRAAMRGTSPNAPFDATLDFAETPDGTSVEVVSDLHMRGAQRLLGPIAVAVYGRAWARGLATLKEMMESGRL